MPKSCRARAARSASAESPPIRGLSKEARRSAIIDSALHLAREHGSDGFSVEQLAQRAGVSRRTVFNYFETLNDVLLAAHTQVMTDLIDDFAARSEALPMGDGSITAVFDDMAQLLQEVELVGPMAALIHLLGTIALDDPAHEELVRETLHRTTEQLASAVAQRAHAADPLDVDLLVHSLLDGLIVINSHWTAQTGATDTPESRSTWTELLEHLISTVRNGYRP